MECSKMILILASLCIFVRAEVSLDGAMRETMPVYTIAVNADILNSTKCRRELEEFQEAVDHRILWSLRMLDTSGKPKSGFLGGNNHWIGQREQCKELVYKYPLELAAYVQKNNSRYRKPEDEYPPFQLNYFLARFTHNSTLQYHIRLPDDDVINLGLCLPSSCTTDELSVILKKIFRERTLLAGQLYSADFKLFQVTDLKDDQQWLFTGQSIFILFLVAVILALVTVGTSIDLFVQQKRRQTKKIFLNTYDNNNTIEVANSLNVEAAAATVESKNRIIEIIMCFSIYTNSKSIFQTKVSRDSIPAIHGLKFLGMAWIILIHTVYYSYPYMDNKTESFKQGQSLISQIVSNSTLSVDTFFFLSGFLLAHVYLNNEISKKKTPNISTNIYRFLTLFLKRFIRITPAYAMIIGLAILNFSWYNNISQFRLPERAHEHCTKYWWRNVLYINNLFDRETMCLSWSWYLSNDMQFFVFGSFVLILSSMYFYVAISLVGGALIASIVLTGYKVYSYNYIPTLDETYRFLPLLYDPPWVRIAPYIIGMATACLLSKLNYELNLNKKTLAFCWCCGITCNCLILFGLFNNHQMSLISSIFYTALSRGGWSVGIGWIVIACSTNNAGPVNWFLCYKAWIPLSKLTYCAYLINPFLISSIFLSSDATTHSEFLTISALFLGMLMISFIVAYALSLALEVPYILLLRMLFENNSKKR